MAKSHLCPTGGNDKTISVKNKEGEEEKKWKERERKRARKWQKKQIALVDPGSEGEEEQRGEERVRISDRQRDKAVVLLDVTFENVWAGTQDALEARSVQFHTLQGAAGDHRGGTRTVHQQSDLTWMAQNT